jgi:hypothetical protein
MDKDFSSSKAFHILVSSFSVEQVALWSAYVPSIHFVLRVEILNRDSVERLLPQRWTTKDFGPI